MSKHLRLNINKEIDLQSLFGVHVYTVGLRDACRHEGNTEEENKGFVVFKRNSTDQRLTANDEVATVLGSIPASSNIVESEGRQMKQC
jgi:hypothetical protein